MYLFSSTVQLNVSETNHTRHSTTDTAVLDQPPEKRHVCAACGPSRPAPPPKCKYEYECGCECAGRRGGYVQHAARRWWHNVTVRLRCGGIRHCACATTQSGSRRCGTGSTSSGCRSGAGLWGRVCVCVCCCGTSKPCNILTARQQLGAFRLRCSRSRPSRNTRALLPIRPAQLCLWNQPHHVTPRHVPPRAQNNTPWTLTSAIARIKSVMALRSSK